MNLPNEIKEYIKDISNKSGLDEKYLMEVYISIFTNNYVQTNEQFTDDNSRHEFSKAVLLSRYVLRPPVKSMKVIPVGYEGVYQTKKGKLISSIYVITASDKKSKLSRIMLSDKKATLYRNITLDSLYETKLGEGDNGTLFSDNRTKFDSPKALNKSPEEILSLINPKRTTVNDAIRDKNSRGSDGYIITTDWRVIKGLVNRATIFKDKNGIEKGVITLMDTTDTVLYVDEEGNNKTNELTVWCAKEWCNVDKEDIVDVYGTITVNDKGEPIMNGYRIVKLYSFSNIEF